MPTHDPFPDEVPETRPLPGAARKKRLRIIAGSAAIAVAAAAAITVSLGLNGPAAEPVDTPATTPGITAAVSTPLQTPPPEPEVTYYDQIGPPAGSPLTAVDPMSIKVSEEKTGTALPEGLVGLSLEATDLADASLHGDNAQMVTTLKGLGTPMLRFGGNAVDRRFFWTSSNEPIPSNLTGDAAHPVRAVTPADLERVNTLLEAADASISLTVSLGTYDPERAADMAKHASRIFGERLVGITVGNEPNGFPETGLRPDQWDINDYLKELKAYSEAIYAVAPQVPIVGPGAFSESWWGPFAEAALPQQKVLSFHYYPLFSCDGVEDPASAPTMTNLMSSNMHTRVVDYQKAALEAGAGLKTWLPEAGISPCRGSNETTKTHASALWSVDYALSGAQLGLDRLSFHSSLVTCTGGPPMSAICAGGAYLKPDGDVEERANYYGLSMVSEIAPGDFLKRDQAGGGLAYSYAVQHADGSTSVIVVNENNPEQSAQTQITLNLPGRALTGTMSQLTGPAYSTQDGTLIDGAKGEAAPVAERATVPGFKYDSDTQTFPLTAGTVTVLNFTY